MFNTEIKSNRGYKYWRITNIKTLTPNNPLSYQINKLLITTKDSDLADDPLKFSSESLASGSFENILDNNLSTSIQSGPDKSSVWWIQYEFETPRWISEIIFNTVSGEGREWQSFELLCSSDGVSWYTFETVKTSVPAENTEDFKYTLSEEYREVIDNLAFYKYWRISNIEKRLNTDPYRSVGNIVFHTKDGLVSNDPLKAISQTSFSEETNASKAFDGLENTYSLSGNLPDDTNTIEHREGWWIGYEFEKPVDLSFVDISMRYDMEGVVDNITDNSLGQDWKSFQIDGSNDGTTWEHIYSSQELKIFKNDNSVHTYRIKENTISAKWWRVSNIINRLSVNPSTDSGAFADGTVAELRFISKSGEISNNPSRAISESFVDDYLDSKAGSAFDNNPQTYAASQYKSRGGGIHKWWIGYEFEYPTEILQISLLPRQTMQSSWGQEWQTADIEYSLDGINWEYYGKIEPRVDSMDLTFKENIPIITDYHDKLIYQEPVNTDNKYKFWRVNNVNADIKTFKNKFITSVSNMSFSNTEGIILNNIFNSFCESGSDPHLAFDEDQTTVSTSVEHFIKYSDYSIGCMFKEPVNVNEFFYNYSYDYDFSKWTSSNIEYSSNGFDWFIKGYSDFSIKSETNLYSIQKYTDSEKHLYWRIVDFISVGSEGVFKGYSSLPVGIRFNTLDGEISNNPKEINPDFQLFFPIKDSLNNTSFERANFVNIGQKISGSVSVSGQHRFYYIDIRETSTIRFYTEGSLDTHGDLYDQNETQIVTNDNGGSGRNFLITRELSPGRYYLRVRAHSSSSTGSFTLFIKNNDELPNNFIYYEFYKKTYVDSVKVSIQGNVLYASLEYSDDGLEWVFDSYLNFEHPLTIDEKILYSLKKDSKNYFDTFKISDLSSTSIVPFNKQPLKPFSANNLEGNTNFINIYNKNNDGMVTGTVTELGVPVQRLVSLYDRRTRKLVATTWPNKDGVYTFTSLDSTRDYYVHSTDSNNFYDAVTKDMIKPL